MAEMTEEQWTALKAWVLREARDWGGGLLNRCGHNTGEEGVARIAFGLPRHPPGYEEGLKEHYDRAREPLPASFYKNATGY